MHDWSSIQIATSHNDLDGKLLSQCILSFSFRRPQDDSLGFPNSNFWKKHGHDSCIILHRNKISITKVFTRNFWFPSPESIETRTPKKIALRAHSSSQNRSEGPMRRPAHRIYQNSMESMNIYLFQRNGTSLWLGSTDRPSGRSHDLS